MEADPGRREWAARAAGGVAALGVMAAAVRAIGWPAPAVSVAIGFGVYVLVRGPRGSQRR